MRQPWLMEHDDFGLVIYSHQEILESKVYIASPRDALYTLSLYHFSGGE